MIKKLVMVMFVVTIALCLNATSGLADGIVIPQPPIDPPCSPPQTCPPVVYPVDPWTQLSIRYHHVKVTIQDQLAVTKVDQVFYNRTDHAVEGIYIFPLPVDAVVNDFSLWIDGEPVQGQVLSAQEARQKYEEIVYTMRDPALLEYIGHGAFQASIFPIAAHEERKIEIEYTQVLPSTDGLVQYVYPLNTEKFSAIPLEDVSIEVAISQKQPIKAVYSPSHPISIEHPNPNQASITYEANDVLPDKDFGLTFSTGSGNSLNLLSYLDPNDESDPDGYFMLLLSAGAKEDNQPIAKDVLIVLDRSGSMEGSKFQQAKTALTYILDHLNPEDRFYINSFSSDIQIYADSLSEAGQTQVAEKWVDQLVAEGATDINRALLETFSAVDPERPTYMIFLTDGLPTRGVKDSQQILDNIAAQAPENVRLFSFGVGYDVDTFLLDSLSQEHHGLSRYVTPEDDLNEAVSDFYAGIRSPLLTNIDIDFGKMEVYDIYPQTIPDLFENNQIVITGRYVKGGTTDITINGDQDTISYQDVSFSKSNNSNDFLASIPRLWATRKIGSLLNEVRLYGAEQEVIDQIVKLSIRYGIVTPYTSYLVTENNVLGADNQSELSREAYDQLQAAPQAFSGADAVQKAAGQGAMSQAEVAPMLSEESSQTVKYAGNRTYVLQDEIWVDTAYDPDQMKPQRIEFLSNQYYELIDQNPNLAVSLAVGKYVIVVDNGKVYQIIPSTNPLPAPTRGTSSEPTSTVQSSPTEPAVTQSIAATPTPVENKTSSTPICGGVLLPILLLGIWQLFIRIH